MTRVNLIKCWTNLTGITLNQKDFWINLNKIPIGCIEKYEDYPQVYDPKTKKYLRKIPYKHIVTIDYDPINTPSTKRNALNILLLGGSGDGKSLLIKCIWSILHDGGYYCGYVDPKSFDAGKSRKGWYGSPRIAPYLEPKGIKLQHFIPVWAVNKVPHLAHNFRKYCTRLTRIKEREMWQGLGMSDIGASHIAKIIIKYIKNKRDLSIFELKQIYNAKEFGTLPPGTAENIYRILMNLEEYEVISDDYPELNLLLEWKQGNSVVISYADASILYRTFDIGQKIKQSLDIQYKTNPKKRIPIMWFFDDSSYYAKKHELIKYNFAVREIMNIGNNTRSLGLYNCMAVQSLGIIDENVAETYKIKLISPMFMNPQTLSKINIPKSAIDSLVYNDVYKDRKNHDLQWIMITPDNTVVYFYPFTPNCNHFEEVYQEKYDEDEIDEE